MGLGVTGGVAYERSQHDNGGYTYHVPDGASAVPAVNGPTAAKSEAPGVHGPISLPEARDAIAGGLSCRLAGVVSVGAPHYHEDTGIKVTPVRLALTTRQTQQSAEAQKQYVGSGDLTVQYATGGEVLQPAGSSYDKLGSTALELGPGPDGSADNAKQVTLSVPTDALNGGAPIEVYTAVSAATEGASNADLAGTPYAAAQTVPCGTIAFKGSQVTFSGNAPVPGHRTNYGYNEFNAASTQALTLSGKFYGIPG